MHPLLKNQGNCVMEKKDNTTVSSCSFAAIKPVMMDLPYPPIQVKGKNEAFANLISIDYGGAVSEMSAITQYLCGESSLCIENCPAAQVILGIAMAEMIHLQKLGQLICLLGGNVDFIARYRDGRRKLWTPEYINISDNLEKIVSSNIEAEKEAINQYKMHIRMMNDPYVIAVLERIIRDEEYHIMMLRALLESV